MTHAEYIIYETNYTSLIFRDKSGYTTCFVDIDHYHTHKYTHTYTPYSSLSTPPSPLFPNSLIYQWILNTKKIDSPFPLCPNTTISYTTQ